MWAASCLSSCCATCACEACKGVASGIGRKSARLAYCGLFALGVVLAWALRDYAHLVFGYVPWVCKGEATAQCYATQAVLRVSFGSFLFFLFFSLLMIDVQDDSDPRDGWHHGGWMFKFILFIGAIALALLPKDNVLHAFGSVAVFGSGLFLLVQVVILLDMAYTWNEAWVEKDEEQWYMALLGVSMSAYLATLIFAGFLFYWFNPGGHDCQLNIFFITFSLFAVLAVSIIALHPEVNGSLLPASLVSLYCMYLCYSALSSEPRKYECNGLASHAASVSKGTLVMGMMTTLFVVVYSALRAGSAQLFDTPPSSPRATTSLLKGDGDEEAAKQTATPVRYSYSLFHFVFALATMYTSMLLTGWGSTGVEGKDIIDVGWTSVWVKICSQWITVALYVWTLVAPLVFPDREFY